jgi:hypothetical protein
MDDTAEVAPFGGGTITWGQTDASKLVREEVEGSECCRPADEVERCRGSG